MPSALPQTVAVPMLTAVRAEGLLRHHGRIADADALAQAISASEAASVPDHGPAESAISDRMLVATLEAASEALGGLGDWRVVVDGVAFGQWPATLETRAWSADEQRFATFRSEQPAEGEPVFVRMLGEVRDA